jgi:ribosome-associated protein
METLAVNRRVRIPLDEFEFTFARGSGPGGQNVNKVSSKAILRWRVGSSLSLPDDVRDRFVKLFHNRITTEGDLVVHSQRFRDQPKNVADCLEKLAAMLALAAKPPATRKIPKPPRAVIEDRLRRKRRQSEKKQARSSAAVERTD